MSKIPSPVAIPLPLGDVVTDEPYPHRQRKLIVVHGWDTDPNYIPIVDILKRPRARVHRHLPGTKQLLKRLAGEVWYEWGTEYFEIPRSAAPDVAEALRWLHEEISLRESGKRVKSLKGFIYTEVKFR